MLGIALAAFSNFFQEISDSIGKYEVRRRAVSAYSFGFLTMFFGTVIMLGEGLIRSNLIFSLDSLPTFLPRLALEILQAHVTIRAISLADRGDFGFVKTFTIPLLLIVDVALGYMISVPQISGMLLIAGVVLVLLYIEQGRVRGMPYLLISTVNAAATISLYKYDITHFNSVEAEQGLIGIGLMIYFFAAAMYFARENPFTFLRKGVFLGQSISSGLAHAIGAFAYLYGPASVITTAMRSFAVLFALLSGKIYFREQHFLIKISLFLLIVLGLVLIIP